MPTDDIDDLTDGQDSTGADGLALTGAELRDTFPSRRYHGQLHERFTLPAEPASHVPAREVCGQTSRRRSRSTHGATRPKRSRRCPTVRTSASRPRRPPGRPTSTDYTSRDVFGRIRTCARCSSIRRRRSAATRSGNSTISSIRSDWTSRSASTTATRNARRRPASARRRTSSSRILPD